MKTHCRQGHGLKNNIIVYPSGVTACKTCRRVSHKKYIDSHPWVVRFSLAKARCQNKKIEHYHRYGGRGIKFLMTVEDFKFLWFRDKAHEMKKPSIDRIDNDGNYELSNCQFIEMLENNKKDQLGEKSHCSKLTEKKVKEIRMLFGKGVRQFVLGKQFSVCRGTIWQIVHYKTWKHI